MSRRQVVARAAANRSLQRVTIRWGTVLLIFGILLCTSLVVMDTMTTFKISMAMIAAGILQMNHAIAGYRRGWSAFGIAGSLLYMLAATAVLIEPWMVAGWASWLLVVSLSCSGLSRIRASIGLPSSSARWELVSGATTMVAATLIYFGMPIFSLWPIAFIVALDIVVEGATLASAGYSMTNDDDEFRPGRPGTASRPAQAAEVDRRCRTGPDDA